MTGKRFYRNRGTIWENDKSMSLGEVEDKLNALSDENYQLKKELDQFYLLIGRGDWRGLVDLIKGDVE